VQVYFRVTRDKNHRANFFIERTNDARTRIPGVQKSIELSKQNLRQQPALAM